MPSWITSIFGNSAIVVTALMAITLNLILPDPDGEKIEAAKEDEEEFQQAA
jgi:xanthine/uracil permease